MFVFSNLATTIDGKIAPASRELIWLGSSRDHAEMQRLRKLADAVMTGASTLRTHPFAYSVRGARKQPWNIILSRGLQGVDPRSEFFLAPGIRRLIFVTGALSAARRKEFESVAEIVQIPAAKLVPSILRELKARGIRRLLVEGGSELMWEFARLNLLDELHVTITPRILGGAQAPTLVGGQGLPARLTLNYRLKQAKRVGHELFLVYTRLPKRGKKHPEYPAK